MLHIARPGEGARSHTYIARPHIRQTIFTSGTNFPQRYKAGAATTGDFADVSLVGIPYDPVNARDSGEFFGRALGVASRNEDLTGRVLAVDATYRIANILVG